ncbi:uncharacterized protein LOC105214793 isoform X2 [Zeugodacus cucurbitae]|uniref:uncharacterized protein LOC105214793 isoform X2 n=3 Tax=Zeugodacus cucurbitae TaxID=28588 RepID=UPI0023D957E3|nr:uncharacterized protein LOC105214793 isoform X2 [Zeugodacus cucurbitae]XP_054082709.1 uncharacterized protein LOC105214793 isoform X2 [Zeugodacus cucurbitae]XP_054082710.1 uncharacterized protein LOC105214793 isoform X2 [Zeugodacus cucurbitae]
MNSYTTNCSPEPLFKEITELFLNTFGTNTIPAGYVEGDNYGPKTNRQDFAKLFRVFYILIVLAVLCVLVLIMMILFILWYCKRRNYESESCSKIKFWTLFITTLLLLSLLLSAFGLYIVFRNISDLKKIEYTKSEDVKENKVDKIGEVVSKTLGKDFEKLKKNAISSCRNSDSLKDLYPATTKVRKISKVNFKNFTKYIDKHIIPTFNNTLLHDDVYRMFSRNFSAYMSAISQSGKKRVIQSNASRYDNYLYTLNDWGVLYNSSLSITKLMPYYAITAESSLRMRRVCMHIEDYFDEISVSVKQQRDFIKRKFKTLFQKTTTDHKAPYKFGYIICIIAIVILAIFLILLLCSLCLKFKAMIKPLIFIYIMLTLAFILMAFVKFYHFFYGVIEYNGLCKYNTRKPKVESFRRIMLKECTNNQNVYTLFAENRWINGLSDWNTIDETKINDDCLDTCTPMERQLLDSWYKHIKEYPNENFCRYKGIDKSWLDNIIITRENYTSEMADYFPIRTYYGRRINRTLCLLDLGKRGMQMLPRETQLKYKQCTVGYKLGKQYVQSLHPAIKEVSGMCQKTIDSCAAYKRELNDIVQNITNFKTKSEDQLKLQLGTCDDMLSSSKRKQEKYCGCDIYILNGVWVGSLIFLLGTLLALLLLPCLLCLFVKCSEEDRLMSRRDRGIEYSESDSRMGSESVHSIMLPSIALPKHVINSILDDSRVRYEVKKMN